MFRYSIYIPVARNYKFDEIGYIPQSLKACLRHLRIQRSTGAKTEARTEVPWKDHAQHQTLRPGSDIRSQPKIQHVGSRVAEFK